MVMWLRIIGVVVASLVAMALLDRLGVGALLGGRTADNASSPATGRSGELFWMLIFLVVMATSVLVAVRRWTGHLRRALVPARRCRD